MNDPISASGLNALDLCEVRAGFTYNLGLREDAGPGAHAGTLIHKVLEKYLNTGSAIDTSIKWGEYEIGKTAAAMAAFLPEPSTLIKVEGNFGYDTPWSVDGVAFRGHIDWERLPRWGDHKSTSSRRWAKTKKKLPLDVQFNLYARRIDEDSVAQWTYGIPRLSGPDEKRAWAVTVDVDKNKIRDTFGRIVLEKAHRFLRMREETDVNRLTHNYDSCHAFNKVCPHHPSIGGGCVHVTAKEKFMSLLKNKKPLIEKLREELGDGDGINSPPMPAGEPADAPYSGELATKQLENPLAAKNTKPKPRGRPRKNTLVEVNEEYKKAAGPLEQPLPDIEVIPSHPPLPEYEDNRPITTLYISCLPLGLTVVYAHDLISAAAQTVCDDTEVKHVRMHDFGKGQAMLAAQLRDDIVKGGNIERLFLDTRATESFDCRQTLISLAQNVVMGV